MTLEALLEISKAYASLGDAVGSQIADVINDPSTKSVANQNANALRLADDRWLSLIDGLANDLGDDELLEEVAGIRDVIQRGKDACPECGAVPSDVNQCEACIDDGSKS